MEILFIPGGTRNSAHVDEFVERAFLQEGHKVKKLCHSCLRTVGQNALEHIRADVLFSTHGRGLAQVTLSKVAYPTVAWLLDDPMIVDVSEKYAKHFDLVFTNEPNTQGIHGVHKCWYLPLGMDAEAHSPAPPKLPMVDVAFIGDMPPERIQLLDQAHHLTQDLSWRIVGPDRWEWSQPTSFDDVWERSRFTYEKYMDVIRSAKVVLGMPRNEFVLARYRKRNVRSIQAAGVGIRPFEVAGCGMPLLVTSDGRVDIFRLFPDGAVATYRHGDAADMAHVVRQYVEDDKARLDMVALGRAICLERHTYRARMKYALEVVQQWKDTQLPPKPEKAKK